MALQLPNTEEDIIEGGGGGSSTSIILANFSFTREAIREFSCPGVLDFDTYLKLIGKDTQTTFNVEEFSTRYLADSTTLTNLSNQYSSYYAGLHNGILYKNYSSSPTAGYIKLAYDISGIEDANLRLVLPGTTPHFKTQLTLRTGGERASGQSGGWVEIIRNPTSLVIQPNSYATSAYPPLSFTKKTYTPADFADGVIPLIVWCGFTAAGGGGSASGCNSSGTAGIYTSDGAGGGAGASGYGMINLAAFANSSGVSKLYCYLGGGGAGGTADSVGDTGSGSGGGRLLICSNTPAATGTFIEAKGGYGGRGTTPGGGGAATLEDMDACCYYRTADSIADIHDVAVQSGWVSDGILWSGGDGGAPGENGKGPGNATRGDGRVFVVRNTPFCWPPAKNVTDTWRSFTNRSGGEAGDGGGGGSSWFGIGGRGATDTYGVVGGPGAGGGGGAFKAGSWSNGGKGGESQIEFYY